MEIEISESAGSNCRQKYLNDKSLMAFIGFLSAFIPLSTDLYLPALPGMASYFNAPVNLINLTLILFFVFYAVCTLLWGPLSDKYGRKQILQTGLAIYITGGILCALSGNIYQLIAFRIVQAVGGSAVTAAATAVVKDVWHGRKRETVLATVYTMVIVAPVIAPIIGAGLLQFTSWRGIFWTLSALGVVAVTISTLLEDTLDIRYKGTLLETMGRLKVVLKNPGFSSLLAIFSLTVVPILSFIAASSYIYIDGFGLTEQQYSYFFSLNGLCAMSGPFLYLMLCRRFTRRSLIITFFVAITVSGCLIFSLGNTAPWLFAVSVIPATICSTALRPPGTNLMFEQQQRDTGTASSLISCFGILTGSLGMLIVSCDWGNVIWALGILDFVTGLICSILWLSLSRKPFVKHIPEVRERG